MQSAHLNKLMQKEVSRKEFLGMSGLAVASLFGLGTVIKLMTGKGLSGHHIMSGYGSMPYGGNKDSH